MNRKPLSLFGFLVFSLFFICVNLLSGILAVTFNYPSLFNVNASFGEYAFPVPFTWALAHWPSIFIYGIPLLHLRKKADKFTLGYRLFCAVSFGLLLLKFDEKIPFVLFVTVDAITGLILSLGLVPPNRKDNPVLFPITVFSAVVACSVMSFVSYSYWQHRTPALRTTVYANGVYELTAINIRKELHEMRVSMDLKERLDVGNACEIGQQVAEDFLQDYPFDSSYNRLIEVWFNPVGLVVPENNDLPYPLGEISLNDVDKSEDGSLPCYLSYK